MHAWPEWVSTRTGQQGRQQRDSDQQRGRTQRISLARLAIPNHHPMHSTLHPAPSPLLLNDAAAAA